MNKKRTYFGQSTQNVIQGEANTDVHPTIAGMMQNYHKNFPELRISNVCKLSRVKMYQLPSVKGFDGDNRHLCMCNMFTLKKCRNKLCKMTHLLPTDMEKAYPEQLANIMSMGVAAAVTNPKEEKGDDYPKKTRVPFLASGG